MATDRYGFPEIATGQTNWNATLTAALQAIDDHLHTRLEADSGEAVAQWVAVYLKSDGKWWKAKADAAATMPALGLAIEAASAADEPVRVQRVGLVTNAGWSWTAGQLIYVSAATAGALTATPPAANVQPVGIAASATTVFLFVGLAVPGATLSLTTLNAGTLRVAGAHNALGAADVADPAAITAADPNALTTADLTDSSGGSKDNVIEVVSGSGADAAINNNFAELAEEIAALKTDLTSVRDQLVLALDDVIEIRGKLVDLVTALSTTTGCGALSG
jgi:hypothetical protein